MLEKFDHLAKARTYLEGSRFDDGPRRRLRVCSPETKALQSIAAGIIALNERIDRLTNVTDFPDLDVAIAELRVRTTT